MKIAAYLIVGPGEADRMLGPVLEQLHWVDAIAVCLNNADPKTRAMVQKHATFYVEDDREWGKEQWRIKQDFVATVVRELRPDWCWAMDADEIFDPRFDRAMAEKLAGGTDVAWYFWCLQLWNADDQVRMDLSFPNVRYWRVMPELGLHFQATALHCGLAPMYAYRYGSQSGLWFAHHGLKTAADRARKVARYDQYDPGAVFKGKAWYDALRNEKARGIPFEDAVRRLPEFLFRSKPLPTTMAKKNVPIFLFTNKRGKVVEAVGEKQRDQFIKAGFTPREELHPQKGGEAPVTKKEEPKEEAPAPATEEAPKAEKKVPAKKAVAPKKKK